METVRVVAFDPSLINLGFSCGLSQIAGDGSSHKLTIECTQTFKIDQLLNRFGSINSHGRSDNLIRMQLATRVVQYCMRQYHPDVIVLEDPIYNKRNPDSLIVQSRGLGIFESAIARYFADNKRWPSQINYKPNVIKQGVGVARDSFKDKVAVTEALEKLVGQGLLEYTCGNATPRLVDDHANDATAMVYTAHQEMYHGMVY